MLNILFKTSHIAATNIYLFLLKYPPLAQVDILLALLCHSFKKDSIMDCGGCSLSLPSHEVGRPSPHTEPKVPTRWSVVNPPDWLLHLYLADLLVLLLLLEVVVEVEVEVEVVK